MGLFRLLFFGLLLYIGYRVLKAMMAPKPGTPTNPAAPRHDGEETVQDPICGVYLPREDAVIGTLEGKRHYFCSMACLEKFREQLDHTTHS
jgi:YHS domain-containing protein